MQWRKERAQQEQAGPFMSRTTSRFALDLDTLKYIQLPTPIQVQRRGISRRLHPNEALALVLGALAPLPVCPA